MVINFVLTKILDRSLNVFFTAVSLICRADRYLSEPCLDEGIDF